MQFHRLIPKTAKKRKHTGLFIQKIPRIFILTPGLLQLSIPCKAVHVPIYTWGPCSLPPEDKAALGSTDGAKPRMYLTKPWGGAVPGLNTALLISNDSIKQASQDSAPNDIITKNPAHKMCPASKHTCPSVATRPHPPALATQ